MWSANVDRSGALLQLAFGKRVDVAQVTDCAQRVRQLFKDLQPGFTLLTDLSGLEEMDLACEPIIGDLMDQFDERGIRRVVRVVPEPRQDIGFGIMALFHYGENVQTITCTTLQEAQQHLP